MLALGRGGKRTGDLALELGQVCHFLLDDQVRGAERGIVAAQYVRRGWRGWIWIGWCSSQGAASECGILAEGMRLATERLTLREFLESDGERVYAIESDPESVVYQSFGPRTHEEGWDYARRHSRDQHRADRDTWDLVVTLRGTEEMIGRCGLGLTRDEPGEALLWFQLDRAVWGRGYATEAARALVDAGFSELGMHRIWADCDPRNAGSIGVLEKVGFRREGHLVENAWIKGEWVDSLIYALLRREWPTVTGRHAHGRREG